jgi:energy-coupling factor transporter transmembrane protein EcfT
MTLSSRRILIFAAILLVAAILAFPMRETVINIVVIPVAFIGWQLGIMYRSLPQIIWWWLILVIIFFLLVYSAMPAIKPVRREPAKHQPRRGQVEDLAVWLGRTKSGVYFKWLVANRLGKLAYQILLQRESGRPRTVFQPLVGEDWQPSRELQEYLETGLHGSFSDFPSAKYPLAVQPKTPLDYDIRSAVEFLESQVENGRQSGSKIHVKPE